MGAPARSRYVCSASCNSRRGDGPALTLPASRKTRALLGYLIATGQPHRRERLCDLFWDGPDDPRAELRWSLSKIRPLLDDGGARLVADRQRVGIELGSAAVDLLSVRSLLGNGVSAASIDALKQAASLFGGEFLDGLDLPVCYRYQEWCMAEREAVSRLRLAVLAELVERLQDHPADALPYARALAVSDPLSEAGTCGGRPAAFAHRPKQRGLEPLRACPPHLRNGAGCPAFRRAGRGPPGSAICRRHARFRRARYARHRHSAGVRSPAVTGASPCRPRCRARADPAYRRGDGETASIGCALGDGGSRDRQKPSPRMHRRTHDVRRRLRLERPRLRTRSGPPLWDLVRSFCGRSPRVRPREELPAKSWHVAARDSARRLI